MTAGRASGRFACIAVGVLLLVTAAMAAVVIVWQARQAKESSAVLLAQLEQLEQTAIPVEDMAAQRIDEDREEAAASGYSLDELDAAGILSIPKLGLKLPVLARTDEQLLKIAVGCFSGEYQPQPNRLVIAGHNYKGHFGRLTELSAGDELSFTPLGGEEFIYTVEKTERIGADQADALQEGEWDLTLLTCNFDRSKRILIRCSKNR